jgi:hypothetical protein
MDAIPVPTTIRRVAASRARAPVKASRPYASGSQRDPNPNSSSSAAASWALGPGWVSRAAVHSPVRVNRRVSVAVITPLYDPSPGWRTWADSQERQPAGAPPAAVQGFERDQLAVPQVRERVVRRANLEQPGFLIGPGWRSWAGLPGLHHPSGGQAGEKVPELRATGVPTSSSWQARAASSASSLIETHRRPSAVSHTASTRAGIIPS